VVAFVTGVILVGVVVLVGGVKLLPLRVVGDQVCGVTALKAAHGLPPLFAELVQDTKLSCQQGRSSGMFSYCSSKAAARDDKANSKENEMMLVGLASWPPTRALVIKALLVREASRFR
jgi:hypothetical protein